MVICLEDATDYEYRFFNAIRPETTLSLVSQELWTVLHGIGQNRLFFQELG